jgi:serine/threonine protein kinase
MGEVYRARDSKLRREVAVKVLREDVAHNPDRLARFEREARMLAQLNHPNVATLFGLEDEGAVQFIVMELVPGHTLSQRLQAGPLSVREALALGRQIAEALETAHAKGVIHRDLKPSNIKITPDGRVKVLDFGLAKALDTGSQASEDSFQTASMTGLPAHKKTLMGTPAYMSPEQVEHKNADQRSDIWSFGCLLYECLSGRQPFAGDSVISTLAAVIGREPDWTALQPDLPPSFRALIQRCLSKRRDDRPNDMALIRRELEQVARELAGAGDTSPQDDLAGLRLQGTIALRPAAGPEESHTDPLPTPATAPTKTYSLAPLRRKKGSPPWSWLVGLLLFLTLAGAGVYIYVDRWRPIESVAVLPFAMPDNDPGLSAFGRQVAQLITSELELRQDLQVTPQENIARISELSSLTPRQAAKRLDVRGIVSGRIVFEYDEQMVTVYVKLTDTWTDRTVWEEKYSRRNDFEGEDTPLRWLVEVASKIAEQLSQRLGRASQRPSAAKPGAVGGDSALPTP